MTFKIWRKGTYDGFIQFRYTLNKKIRFQNRFLGYKCWNMKNNIQIEQRNDTFLFRMHNPRPIGLWDLGDDQ